MMSLTKTLTSRIHSHAFWLGAAAATTTALVSSATMTSSGTDAAAENHDATTAMANSYGITSSSSSSSSDLLLKSKKSPVTMMSTPKTLMEQQQQQQTQAPPNKSQGTPPPPPAAAAMAIVPDLRPTQQAPRSWRQALTDLLFRPNDDDQSKVPWPVALDRHSADLLRDGAYAAFPDPAAVMIPSHAIAGALLKEHHIEAYRVYYKTAWDDERTTDDDKNVARFDVSRTAAAAASDEAAVVALVRVGTRVDGHAGIVHGGILAMLVDDVLGYGFYSVGWPAAFTANLSVDYRAPVPAQTILRLECRLEKYERRKLYWRVRVTDAHRRDKVYVEATCLFVIPRHVHEKVWRDEEEKKKKMQALAA